MRQEARINISIKLREKQNGGKGDWRTVAHETVPRLETAYGEEGNVGSSLQRGEGSRSLPEEKAVKASHVWVEQGTAIGNIRPVICSRIDHRQLSPN